MKYRVWVPSWTALKEELEVGPREGIWDAQSAEDMSWSKIKGILSKDPVEGAEKADIIARFGSKVGEAYFKVLEIVEAL